jgi:hypothetical protein
LKAREPAIRISTPLVKKLWRKEIACGKRRKKTKKLLAADFAVQPWPNLTRKKA